ncbi:hypothetical protein M0802_002931 [Mischocyttarus mexicanus]|nr:hypothetical protein M0802_002931 [Mischocyttarus mexicanus]
MNIPPVGFITFIYARVIRLFDVFGRPLPPSPPIPRYLPTVFVTFFRRPLTSTLPPPLEQSQSWLLLLDSSLEFVNCWRLEIGDTYIPEI